MLKSQIDTPEVELEVMRAAAQRLNNTHHHLSVAFEHGHWWASCADCGGAWDAVDCQRDGADYIDFEQVSDGDNYCMDEYRRFIARAHARRKL